MYDLFEKFAHRYDLHTPPDHYKHDHAFVLDQARQVAPGGRLLDVGCGTGAFLEKALAAGFDAYGADASAAMIDVAAAKVGRERVRVERMQDLDERETYDIICSLSWTIHYCESEAELADVVRRCAAALRPGGLLILQVANSERMTGAVRVDREPGPDGEPDDTIFVHRFTPIAGRQGEIVADYVYISPTLSELMIEQHWLQGCAPLVVERIVNLAGLKRASVVDPDTISPFVIGMR